MSATLVTSHDRVWHISQATDLLRLIVPLEALVGFALLTASVSWLLTVYPALSRRRSLAYEITLLREVTRRSGRGDFVRRQAGSAERLFAELLSRLVAVERDLVQIPLLLLHPGRRLLQPPERHAVAAGDGRARAGRRRARTDSTARRDAVRRDRRLRPHDVRALPGRRDGADRGAARPVAARSPPRRRAAGGCGGRAQRRPLELIVRAGSCGFVR